MTRPGATASVQRMLSLLPLVAARPDGVPIDELCSRYDVSREKLQADLDVVSLVGVAPYTPDLLVEVVVEDDRVFVHLPVAFDRPLRLTPDEGLSLLAAGRSLLAVPGADPEGPLARALAKLATVLDVDADRLDVDLGPAEAGNLAVLQAAIAGHERVQVRYYGYGRDESTEREIDPHRLFHDQGHWYVAAFCHRADGDRVFRVDRIEAATPTGATFAPPAERPSLGAFRPNPDDPRVVLELESAARWVVEQYPTEGVDELGGGRVRVTLAVAARPWLERLLVRLGPLGRVVGGDPDLADLGREAASRILGRYADR